MTALKAKCNKLFFVFASISVFFSTVLFIDPALAEQETSIDEIVVWGTKTSNRFNPVSRLNQEDIVSINVATTEDIVKYEPGVVIRRRFIGDSNGVIGMRGSNMFQTSRSMVFADGVPLHYLLQSRWNGAPRWTMVSASEIAEVEVLYGPYSAEYSGNSMGGVISIETAIPQGREIHFDTSYFSQNFSDYGFEDDVSGYKSFFSIGDKIGDTSLYFSVNKLENESQPQSFYYATPSQSSVANNASGVISDRDDRGNDRLYFGDTGVVDTETNNYKFKLGHEIGQWSTLLNIAYEDRASISNQANSYLRDEEGKIVYGGKFKYKGEVLSARESRLSAKYLERRSLSSGLRLRNEISDGVEFEANINQFKVLKDQTRASATHILSDKHSAAGQLTDYGDTGWNTAEAKLRFTDLDIDGLSIVAGFRHETFELNLDVFNSDDYNAGTKTRYRSRSGGKTRINAIFAQAEWNINDRLNAGFGLRYEDFESSEGYYDNDDINTAAFELAKLTKEGTNKASPKFSLGYRINDIWDVRYALAKAYRFPIVEELFSQYEAYNNISIANPGLKPEDGVHQNVTIERALTNGYFRINVFSETIGNVIESQSTIIDGGTSLRTFIPIDEIKTNGAELIVNASDFGVNNFDLRFNATYTDAEITKNAANPKIEGNTYPRMPNWRGNVLATYHVNSSWDVGASLQYSSDSFGRSDNTDYQNGVYGAQDRYTRIGLKSTYRISNEIALGLGVDNITNEIAYVAHPWPGRTIYASFAYDF